MADPSQRFHVPDVVFRGVHCTLTGEKMERREPKICERVYRPAVLSVGIDVSLSCFAALSVAFEKRSRLWNLLRLAQRPDRGWQCRSRCRAGWCVLLAQQLLRFRGPRHEFAIEADPVCFERLPNSGSFYGVAQTLQNLALQQRIIKESASRPRVTNASLLLQDSEALSCRIGIAADDHYCPRSHVLLFADDFVYSFVKVVSKCLFGML